MLPLLELPPRSFETERLKLRLLQAEDTKLIFDLYCDDPVATKYMSFKCTHNIEDTRYYVENSVLYSLGKPSAVAAYTWLIILKSSDQAIGSAGFGPKNNHTLNGGYILNQKFWGKGYASEAWVCITDWAKKQAGVKRIEAYHHPDNPASGKIMIKAGMKCEGLIEKHSVYPNLSEEPRDAVVYAWEPEG